MAYAKDGWEILPFYDERYIVPAERKTEAEVDTDNPVAIYRYLLSRVYKQDDYCRDAAMILYDHLRGITSRNIVCGPSGCGKTFVWNCLKDIFPGIVMVDAASLSKDGWEGDYKVTDFILDVDPGRQNCIVVFDEFDKCAVPQYTSYDENVSAVLQSEFLKLVEGKKIRRRYGREDVMIDTSAMSFVFCGSFAQKAEEIASSKSSRGLGFGNIRKEAVAYEKELCIKDLMEFGVITELASRCTRLINLKPLTLEDYVYLISEYKGSPVKSMERKYGLKIDLAKEQAEEIAKEAHESGLGIRNVTAQIQRMMDDRIFARFLEEEHVH